jgi:intracellular sulfur oxidation DsrE/DsrF family protein
MDSCPPARRLIQHLDPAIFGNSLNKPKEVRVISTLANESTFFQNHITEIVKISPPIRITVVLNSHAFHLMFNESNNSARRPRLFSANKVNFTIDHWVNDVTLLGSESSHFNVNIITRGMLYKAKISRRIISSQSY